MFPYFSDGIVGNPGKLNFTIHKSDSMWGTDYIAILFFLDWKFLGQSKIWDDNSVEKLFR